jgi:hypothetical protein
MADCGVTVTLPIEAPPCAAHEPPVAVDVNSAEWGLPAGITQFWGSGEIVPVWVVQFSPLYSATTPFWLQSMPVAAAQPQAEHPRSSMAEA